MRRHQWRSRNAEVVLAAAARRHAVTVRELTSDSQVYRIVRARLSVIRDLHQMGFSSPEIGRVLGGRSHTTILYHLAKLQPIDDSIPYPDLSGEWAI